MTAAKSDNRTIARQMSRPPGAAPFEPDRRFLDNNRLTLDITNMVGETPSDSFLTRPEVETLAPRIMEDLGRLQRGEGDCRDGDIPMLGWMSLPDEITTEHLDQVVAAARELSDKTDIFVSLGIGGSYLGIEATFKALTHTWFNQLTREQRGGAPQVYFLGQNTDPDFLRDTLDLLQDRRVGINVISKSGTTTETAIAFRILRDLIERQAGSRARELIVATTDRTRGALRQLADQKGYRSFEVPDNVGGRFSVLTDVGLFGLAVAGIDIHEFVAGFRHMKQRTATSDFWTNPAAVHAAVRSLAYRKGKKIEVVATNSAAIYQLTRWMEQLFPESEGHNGQGLWVSPSMYSEKLHANGQMVQQGERNLIETFLRLRESDNTVPIPDDPENLDGLNYLSGAGRDMNFVNQLVIDGPAFAHRQGGVPNMTLDIPRRNAFNLGQFYYMMELSVALSGYLAGLNPFIQPGVEAYKKAMFALAGKPGSEEEGRKMQEAMANTKRTKV